MSPGARAGLWRCGRATPVAELARGRHRGARPEDTLLARHLSVFTLTATYFPPMRSCLLPIALLAILACEHVQRLDAPPLMEEQYAGMVRIRAAGTGITLGAADSLAKLDEMPPMRVAFSYDFWIDRTEVTQEQYLAVTGSLPREYDGRLSGAGIPIAHVTWYDAALYCNARSKARGLDTVYTFSRVERAPGGAAIALVNLAVRYEAAGYRLPTEAEWEYAARGGSADAYAWGADLSRAGQYAWFLDNAGRAAHPVAALLPNHYGLYDMAGNVMEWAGDWKGPYADTLLADFVGAPASESDLRCVKGGSFAHGAEYLRPAARSETYETYSSSSTRYIGFRCALGPVRAPAYLVAGAAGDSSSLGFTHTATWVTPTPRARLAFVRRDGESRTLCTVDFDELFPALTEYRDRADVYLPTISPDGRWVSFCTAGEGQHTGSSVYVRPFGDTAAAPVRLADQPAFVPRWWVDPATRDTFVVYTSSTALNNTAAWRQSRTLRVRFSAGAFAGPPEVIEEAGSYHGGLSADGRYLATGLPLLIMRDRTAGLSRVLFTGTANGKGLPDDTSQVCNVSISPSAAQPDEALFIDFGSYGRPSAITGDIYGVHEYLFRVTFANQVTAVYRCPAGASSWDHPEWSTVYQCAVAGALDRQGRRYAIYGVNLAGASYAQLVWSQRSDLWHPYLWVDPRSSPEESFFALDSLGRYNEPRSSEQSQPGLATKMARFWRHCAPTELMFIGSSRVEGGVAPSRFTGFTSFNLSTAGMRYPAYERLILDYVLPHCPRLKLIGINLHPGWMADTGYAARWSGATGQTKGYIYDRNHGFWAGGLPAGFTHLVSKAPNGLDGAAEEDLGFVRRPSRGWPNTAFAGSEDWTTADTNYAVHFAVLRRLADTLAARGVHFLVIAFPQSWAYRRFTYNGKRYYGRYGPLLSTAEEIWADLRELEAQNPFFHFYDAHLFGWHDYQPMEAYDADHLAENGAYKLTARLDRLIHVFLPQPPAGR